MAGESSDAWQFERSLKRYSEVWAKLDPRNPFDARKKIPREDVKQYPASLR